VSGTGERILEADVLKRVFALAPSKVKAYVNINDPNDPKNVNVELSIDSSVISQPTQDALNLKADKTYVDNKIADLINNAPAALDTLKELAQALDNNASFSTSITNLIATKAPINNPTFTGTVGGLSKAMVNLSNVDDTSDANKPISTAMQTTLNLKAPINNPTCTGTVSVN